MFYVGVHRCGFTLYIPNLSNISNDTVSYYCLMTGNFKRAVKKLRDWQENESWLSSHVVLQRV